MRRLFLSMPMLAAALAAAPSAQAFSTGTYRCASFNMAGAGGSCRLTPPIEIRPDGGYRESSTTGTYRIDGDRIVFSASAIRGPGSLLAGGRIRFEYTYQGRAHTVTYYCAQNCEERDARAQAAAPAAAKTAAASGKPVWLDLTLRFPRPDGVLGWASTAHLVPYASAREFLDAGRKTPPAGSATGLARQEGRGSAVVAATFRQARGGVRYVVFLDTGREHLPVALLDLADGPAEQSVALAAALLKEIPAAGAR